MKIDPRSSIGDVLRQARLASKISQGSLAKRLGISIWSLNRVEHGKGKFDTDWMECMPPSIRSVVKTALDRETRDVPGFARRAEVS